MKDRLKEIEANAELIIDGLTNYVVGVELSSKDYSFLIGTIKDQQQEIDVLKRGKEICLKSHISLEREIERYENALDSIAHKTFNVEPKRAVVKMQSIARDVLGNKRVIMFRYV